jgi:hypothetical protein
MKLEKLLVEIVLLFQRKFWGICSNVTENDINSNSDRAGVCGAQSGPGIWS